MPGFSSSAILHGYISHEAIATILTPITLTQGPDKRQVDEFFPEETCGYLSGDPTRPRTADIGWDCRFDLANSLWGFCPQTVIDPRDCGLAGYCVDQHECSDGCGRLVDWADITTVTCQSKDEFCSTALLDIGPDQTYEYIACGATATVQVLLPNPTPARTTSASQTSSTLSIRDSTSTSLPQSTSPPTSAVILPAETSSAKTANDKNPKQSNIGAIVGGVVGSIALICATILAVFWLRRKHASKKHSEALSVDQLHNDHFDMLPELVSSGPQKGFYGMWNKGIHVAPVEMEESRGGTLSPAELPVHGR